MLHQPVSWISSQLLVEDVKIFNGMTIQMFLGHIGGQSTASWFANCRSSAVEENKRPGGSQCVWLEAVPEAWGAVDAVGTDHGEKTAMTSTL
jgi:hypothetical protein